MPGNRVLLAGGQNDYGEDLFDTYYFDSLTFPTRFYDHDAEKQFEDLVDSDTDLVKLFSERDEHTGRGGPYIGPATAGSVQLWGFGGHLITKAWELARFDSVAPAPGDVAGKLDGVLAAVRRIARGKGVDLPARVGLTGVLLPDDFEPIEVGPVRIRRSDERDDSVVASTTLSGSIGAVADDSQAVQIDYAGNIVLETTSRYRIKLAKFELLAEDVDRDAGSPAPRRGTVPPVP